MLQADDADKCYYSFTFEGDEINVVDAYPAQNSAP